MILKQFYMIAFFLGVTGCAKTGYKYPESPFPVPEAAELPSLHPERVSNGDVLEVAYFVSGITEEETYRIGVGDVLKITVADHEELNADEVTVLPDGTISLDEAGSLKAADLTIDELTRNAVAAFTKIGLSNPRVGVTVVAGQQRLRQFMSFLESYNGGTKLAISVFNDDPIDFPLIKPVEVNRPIREIREEIRDAYQAEFGARLAVTVNLIAREDPTLYIMGEVNDPGAKPLTKPVNLVAAIAMAGGFAKTAAKGEVLVLRFADSGDCYYWRFDVRDEQLIADNQGYMELSNNDVVFVTRSRVADANLFVEQSIRGMLPFDTGVGISIRAN